MKTPTFLAAFAIFSVLAVGTASATTTLIFSSGATARMSGFANAAGAATDGLRFGMIIDTAGDGFDNTFLNTTYDKFNISASGFVSTTVNGVSSASDDYFFVPGALPTTASATAVGTETGTQISTITSLAGAPNGTDGLISGVTTNDSFAIIWFNSTGPVDGESYGLFNIPAFALPASGTSVSFASNFTGNDGVRTMNYSFTNIPEPSRALLLGFGAVGLMFRRRRA